MRALSLFVVFALAKLPIIAGQGPSFSPWSPIAFLWQDALVALAFAGLDFTACRLGLRRIAILLYAALCLYAAINIPVGRAVFTPLTWPMLLAARGPLADSMLRYATPRNAGLILLTLAAACILPRLVRRLPRAAVSLIAVAAMPVILLGPLAARRVHTLGMDRNVVATLVAGALPHVVSRAAAGDWRTSRFAGAPPEDLSWLSGLARGRNIIMISLESTAAQYLPLYGGDARVTPHLAALAQSAVVFDNAYAAYPESIKGLFSILCSTFPAFDIDARAYAAVPCRSLPQVLAESGYRTALFHSGRFAYLGMESVIRHRGYQTLEDAGDIGGNHQSSFGVDEPSTVARILSWIDGVPRGERFFLTYLPIAGHHPYETPARGPFPENTDLDRYRNALHYGDASLGALIEGIRARGLADRTVWVVFGDHGEAFGQHAGNFGHTFFLYDENVRVPLLIAATGLPGQVRARKVVSLVDVAPTVLDLARITAPPSYQGLSMLDPAPRMALFFADYSLGLLGLRDGPWKCIYEMESARTQVFDVGRDPAERTDLAAREAARAAWYVHTLKDWSGAQKSYLASVSGRRQ